MAGQHGAQVLRLETQRADIAENDARPVPCAAVDQHVALGPCDQHGGDAAGAHVIGIAMHAEGLGALVPVVPVCAVFDPCRGGGRIRACGIQHGGAGARNGRLRGDAGGQRQGERKQGETALHAAAQQLPPFRKRHPVAAMADHARALPCVGIADGARHLSACAGEGQVSGHSSRRWRRSPRPSCWAEHRARRTRRCRRSPPAPPRGPAECRPAGRGRRGFPGSRPPCWYR